jgi:hypothetical protein
VLVRELLEHVEVALLGAARFVHSWGLAHLCGATTEAAPPVAVFDRWAPRTRVSTTRSTG